MSQRRHTLAVYADANLNDAMTACALIDPALEAIDRAKAGFPTSTPGANPNTPTATIVDGEAETSTSTERAALTPDKASNDEKALRKAIHAASKELRIIARLTQVWATPSLDGTSIRERLAAVDANIWCANHLRHGMHETRRTHFDTCESCGDFRIRYKRDAPFEVLDYQARHGRLYETQIRRLLTMADDRIAAERRARKAEEKATA
jgi:hypothetical protein